MSEMSKTQPVMVLDSQDAWAEEEVKRKVWTGPLDKAIEFVDQIYNWGRRSSIWPMSFGLACCAIEMIVSGSSRYDIARFGAELFRPSPRQADLMIVAGTVTKKMVPAIVRLYNQMAEPKYVLAMGACASAGGPFKEGYNVVSGIDKFLPVDVYAPGCPPTPQALLNALITLQKKIDAQSVSAVPWYQAESHEAVPEPVYGPDLYDPRRAYEIKQLSQDPDSQEQLYVHIASRAETKHGKKEAETSTRPQPAAAQAAARAAKPAPSSPVPPSAPSKAPAETPAAQPPTTPSAAQDNTEATRNISPESADKPRATRPAPDSPSPAPGMISGVMPPAGGPVKGDVGKGGETVSPAPADATPAAPPVNAGAAVEATRGEVRPIPATEPDKLMVERKQNPPGRRDPDKPAAAGLPSARPKDEARLAELKADADFAAKAEMIHRRLAEGTPSAVASAEQIEKSSEEAVRERLGTAEESRGVIETEPNAGESKEATKKFLEETGADKLPPKENPIVQPSSVESRVATEKYRQDVKEPKESHQDNPETEGGEKQDKTEK